MTHMIDAGKAQGSSTDRDARARKAVSVFRSMQPVLTGYARAITKRNDVRVILSSTSNGETDGKNIMMRPPIALGDASPHDYSICNRRDLDKRQLCPACAKRERVVVTIFHEIGHIAGNSFMKPTDDDIKQLLSDAVRASGSYFGKMLAARIRGTKYDNYLGMAQDISEFMHPILNALEDARIDSAMFKARPGIRPMYEALLNEVRDDGIEFQNPDSKEIYYEKWSERPLNYQIIFGLYCVGTRYNYTGWFDPQVSEDLQDEKLVSLVTTAATSTGVREVYYGSFLVLERLRELGYCKLPDEPEPEPEPDEKDDESEQDESDQEPQPSVPSDCDEDEKGDSDDKPEDETDEDPEESQDDTDESDEDEDDGDKGDSGDPEDSEGDSGSNDSGDGGSGSGGEGSAPDSDQESSDDPGPEPEEDESVPPEDEDGESEESPGGGDSEEGTGSRDTGEPDESPDARDNSADGVDVDDTDTDLDDGLGDDRTPAPEDEPVEPKEMGDPEGASEFLHHAHDGSMEKALGHGATEPAAVMDLSKMSKAEIEEAKEDLKAIIIAVVQGLFFDQPSRRITAVREHRRGQSIIENGREISNGWGDDRFTSDVSIPESIMGRALMKMRVAFSDNQRGARRTNLKTGRVNGRVLGRRAPVADDRLFLKTDRPKRKKYAVVLGVDISGSTSSGRLDVIKRAVYAQAELCSRMGLPFEIYAHTGSPSDYDEYTWGGDLALDIYVIKDIHEPWNEVTQNRLKGMRSTMCNLDGHTLEYYRKALDRADGNTKILVYYTDGAMPCENFEEELEILQREVRTCKRNKYVMLFVGVQNDEPKEKYNLDMVRLDDDSDIQRVVDALGNRIDSA